MGKKGFAVKPVRVNVLSKEQKGRRKLVLFGICAGGQKKVFLNDVSSHMTRYHPATSTQCGRCCGIYSTGTEHVCPTTECPECAEEYIVNTVHKCPNKAPKVKKGKGRKVRTRY